MDGSNITRKTPKPQPHIPGLGGSTLLAEVLEVLFVELRPQSNQLTLGSRVAGGGGGCGGWLQT